MKICSKINTSRFFKSEKPSPQHKFRSGYLAAWQGGNKHRIDGINMDRIAGCRFARLACAREHALPDLSLGLPVFFLQVYWFFQIAVYRNVFDFWVLTLLCHVTVCLKIARWQSCPLGSKAALSLPMRTARDLLSRSAAQWITRSLRVLP